MKDTRPWEEAVFEAARHLPEAQQADYLKKVCAGDEALLQKVHALLSAQVSASRVLSQPLVSHQPTIRITPPPEPPGERVGDVIGRYKLMEKIGEGGFGAVYVADQ